MDKSTKIVRVDCTVSNKSYNMLSSSASAVGMPQDTILGLSYYSYTLHIPSNVVFMCNAFTIYWIVDRSLQ